MPISYESRLIKLGINEEVLQEIDHEIEAFQGLKESEKAEVAKRTAQLEALV